MTFSQHGHLPIINGLPYCSPTNSPNTSNQTIGSGEFITAVRSLEDLRLVYPHLWEKIDAFRMEKIRIMTDYIIRTNSNSSASGIDPRIFAAVMIAAIQAVVNPTFIVENGLTFEEVIAQLSRFLLAPFAITLE